MSDEKKQRLGRPGNNVKIGIVGLPNVGKSSFFNTLSTLQVPAENFPFCTIDPNVTRVIVPDARFDDLVAKFHPASVVPAVLTVTDIAGLVKGAHEGKGLGNAFLSHITAVDAIFHMVRAFKAADIEHVEGSVDPVRDLEIISDELILKDLDNVAARLVEAKKILARDKNKKQDVETLTKAKEMLEAKRDIREGKWTNKDVDVLNELQLLTAKPIVYLVNITLKNFEEQKNQWLAPIKKWVAARSPGAPVVPFSAAAEAEIQKMDDEAKAKYFVEKKVRSMLPKIITTGYHILNLIHFFTCGEDEVRAWTVQNGSTAPMAAGVIHTDFQKGFIAAEQYNYEDFKEGDGTEQGVRKLGKLKTQGKLYVVRDGDILFFKHNTPAVKKAKPAKTQ